MFSENYQIFRFKLSTILMWWLSESAKCPKLARWALLTQSSSRAAHAVAARCSLRARLGAQPCQRSGTVEQLLVQLHAAHRA